MRVNRFSGNADRLVETVARLEKIGRRERPDRTDKLSRTREREWAIIGIDEEGHSPTVPRWTRPAGSTSPRRRRRRRTSPWACSTHCRPWPTSVAFGAELIASTERAIWHDCGHEPAGRTTRSPDGPAGDRGAWRRDTDHARHWPHRRARTRHAVPSSGHSEAGTARPRALIREIRRARVDYKGDEVVPLTQRRSKRPCAVLSMRA